MKTVLKMMSTLLLIATISCNENEKPKPIPLKEPIKIELTEVEKDIVATEKNNAMRFFSLVQKAEATKKEKKSNFMLSPYSLNIALSMVWNGAKGETKAGIEKALGYKENYVKAINAYHHKMAESLEKTDPSTKLAIANSIWFKETATLKETFRQANEKWYDAEVKGVNFSQEETKNLINKWCEDKTQGLIKKVIDRTSNDDMIYLINALYFKGIWAGGFEFKTSDTKQQDFTLEDKTKVKVPMMYQKSEISYLENEMFAAVSLPYGNGAYSMIVILPQLDETLLNMSDLLMKTDVFAKELSKFQRANVELHLPKFKIEYDIELNSILQTMGMTEAFLGSADFTDAFEKANFYISKVSQFTAVDVNEKGTEAAAVTVVEGKMNAAEPAKEVVFRADRPFAFLIQENSTGSILFMGKVGNPNEK